jgi:ATP-dependent DNA ligase
LIDYVALGDRSCMPPTKTNPQRHITPNGTEEIKLDGYRAIAIKSRGKVQLRSRNDNDFTSRYPGISIVLGALRRRGTAAGLG